MKRIPKIIAGIVVLVALALGGAVLAIPDSTLSSSLGSLPVVGAYTDDIISLKHKVLEDVAYEIDDAFYAVKSTYRDIVGLGSMSGVPRVVIELEPVRRKPAAMPATDEAAAAQPEPMSAQPEPIPMTAAQPEPMPAAEPMAAAEQVATAEPEPVPESAPAAQPEPMPTAEPQPEPMPTVEPQPEPMPAEQPAPQQQAALPATPTPEPASPAQPELQQMDADADHKRGLLYYKGISVPKDYAVAANWFERAAEKGHAGAQYNLGIMNYLGQGMEQDFAKAAEWFRKAGEQDHAAAQYNLGFLYYEGKGVDKDDLQAFMWIDRAANLGDEKAAKARDTLAKILPEDIFKQQ